MRSSRILSNAGWILLGSGFNKVSSIFLLVILSRYLGVKEFGKFSFAFFYIQLFSCIAEFGLTPILTKHISVGIVKSGEIQSKGISLGLITTAVGILSAWMGTYLLGYQDDLRYLIVISSLGLLISFRDVTFRWILEVPFRAKLKMAYPVILGILSELLGLFMVLGVIYWQGSLETILTVYVLSNLPGFIWLSVISIRRVKPSLQAHSIPIKQIIKEATPIGVSNIFRTVYLVFGALVLFQFKGETEVGYYALAFRLTTSLRIIPEAMMHSLFPLIAKAHVEEPPRVREMLKSAINYGAFIASPLALGTMAVAPAVVILLAGEQFRPAATALSILIWATFFAFFNTVLRFAFDATSKQKYNFKIYGLMLFLSVTMAFVLIPKYGFIGAACSLVASEGAGFFYGLIQGHLFELAFPIGSVAKHLLAALVMAAGICFLPSLPLQIGLGSIIYIAVRLLIKRTDKDKLLNFSSVAFHK
jgi:PST family polysaccharide transporter